MRLCPLAAVLAAWIACAVWLPARVRAQSGADVSPVIPVHPDVPTVVQLPDEIQAVRSADNLDIMVKGVGSTLYLRPRPDTPAGVEVFIEVNTLTLHRIFLVRVVERAEDAIRELVVPAAATAEPSRDTARDAPFGPEPPAPTASAPATAPNLAPVPAAPESAEPVIEHALAPETERIDRPAGSPRFDLSVHGVAALAGVTALSVPGYAPDKGRRSHRAFGLRVAVMPRDTWWSVEAGLSGEWLAAPTIHVREISTEMGLKERKVSGPRLRLDGGLKAQAGTIWRPTVYVGLGLQAHLSKTEDAVVNGELRMPKDSTEDMTYNGVLTLGLGLQYQARDVLLGIDFQMRQGVPGGYRSVDVFLSVGFFLHQGE